MATSAVEICNIALLRIGQKQSISSLTDASAAAKACKALYDTVRDSVLEDGGWPFATKRAALAPLAGIDRDDWVYAYAAPSDMISPRFIPVGGIRNPRADQRVPFAIESNDTGDARIILTDQPNAILSYTARITSVPQFTPLFQSALAYALAAELCLALPIKPAVAEKMQAQYERTLNKAWAASMRSQTEDAPPDVDYIGDRE